MNCKVCFQPTTPFERAVILQRHEVQYYRCGNCGFIQTEEPYWLDEAYSSAISDLDLGTVSRGLNFGKTTKSLILTAFDCNAKFVDYGGGYGFFVRLMRDAGFDFYRIDKYAENLFAKGFDVRESGHQQYELATAFEVFEHLVRPLDDIETMLSYSRNILFSTLLVPEPTPRPGQWWYYVLGHGQHVALYTQESLQFLAKKFGLNLYSDGSSLHLFTVKRLPPFIIKAVERFELATVLNMLQRRKLKKRSLLPDDFNSVTGMHLD